MWKTAYECSNIRCKHVLSERDRMYSNGTCPYCGQHREGTITDSVAKIYRLERNSNPWWSVLVGKPLYRKVWKG